MKQEYRTVPVIPCEDDLLHTTNRPFCADTSCPCHSDADLLDTYCSQPYQDGLLTSEEEQRLQRGEHLIIEAYWDRERAMP